MDPGTELILKINPISIALYCDNIMFTKFRCPSYNFFGQKKCTSFSCSLVLLLFDPVRFQLCSVDACTIFNKICGLNIQLGVIAYDKFCFFNGLNMTN